MICFDNVFKKYSDDKIVVVNNVILDIKDGEFFVFIGLSGCGKIIILKMINCLILLIIGIIYINEKWISDYDIYEFCWDIGYVL